jgi:DNA-binding transcriptional LysR family regulator
MGPDERLFLRVVDTGSMKRAALQLGANPSTVTRRLAALEERLGIKLLNRSTRKTTPTDAGAAYADGLRRLLGELDALEAEVSGAADEPRGRLVVTSPGDFGNRFVVPVIDELLRRAPELEVELIVGSRFFDIAERGIDVAIRVGALRDSVLRARRLGWVPRVLVAAPSYLKAHGTPAHPRELARHHFVLYARLTDPQLSLEGDDGNHRVPMHTRVMVNNVVGAQQLVRAGHGLYLGPRWAYQEDLDAGRVVEVLPAYRSPAYPLNAVFVGSSYVPAKVRAFVDAMVARCADEPSLQKPGGQA